MYHRATTRPAIIAGARTNIEDLRATNVSHNLTPNPIYGGPLYETVGDRLNDLSLPLFLKPELPSPRPSPSGSAAEPKYTDSPTTGQLKLPTMDQEATQTKKETDDCYIQMHTKNAMQ